jgi:hypothetical protein
MDPRVREVIEGAMQACGNDLRGIEELNDTKMGNILETCFGKNSGNPERFADCIVEKQKKMEDILSPMQFKIMYFSKSSHNCLTQQNKSVSDCTQEAIKGIR